MRAGQASGRAGDNAAARAIERATWLGRALPRTGGVVSQHTLWCRDTLLSVATWLAFMVSLPTVAVATQKLKGEPLWCRDPQFGVAT